MSDDQEQARKELIKRGVIKDPTAPPEPQEPAEPQEEAPAHARWLCAIKHRWGRWEPVQVTMMLGGMPVGDKTHQRRTCHGCGKAEVVEVFV